MDFMHKENLNWLSRKKKEKENKEKGWVGKTISFLEDLLTETADLEINNKK